MDFTHYSSLASRTLPENDQTTCGLTGKQLEYLDHVWCKVRQLVAVAEPIKKHIFHGHDDPRTFVQDSPAGSTQIMPMNKVNMALGLVGEACEAALAIIDADDPSEIGHELGDVLWYVNGCAETNGLKLNEIAAYNIHKLQKRYPAGFNQTASRDRE